MLYRSYVFVRINLCRTHFSFIILLIVCQIFSCIVSQFISWCKKLLILHYKAVSQNCTIEKYFMIVVNVIIVYVNKNLTQNYCLRHLRFLTTNRRVYNAKKCKNYPTVSDGNWFTMKELKLNFSWRKFFLIKLCH